MMILRKYLCLLLLLLCGFSACRRDGDEEAAGPAVSPEELRDAFLTDVRPTDPLAPEEERLALKVPPGFEVQLFASEPDIGKPLNMAFDARGRLWVTQSREYPFPAEGRAGRDRVSILEDSNGDGRADKVTHFADDLNIPIGVVPVQGGAIVFSIPYIYRLLDFDGDDRADDRVALLGGFGHRDTHGMVNSFLRGFDGWILACHGFNNSSEVQGRDGNRVAMTSGNTFRFRSDGSRVEAVTTGQVNPFGLSLDALGNLYSADCHSHPVYQLLRGADYPHFSKQPTGIGFGPAMIDHTHDSTAISGITYYAADHFPPEYRDNIFTGNVLTSRINRDSLEEVGSTRRAIAQPDFVVSADPWFRPVDIKLGPDGALYVADFYNRIIGHYEVPLDHPGRDRERGRIWRIVYTGREAGRDPAPPRSDWTAASADDLVEDLDHSNLTVRLIAADQLVERIGAAGAEKVRPLLTGGSAFQKSHALWILYRLGRLEMSELETAARDEAPLVRIHAQRVLAERPDFGEKEAALARTGLDDPDATVRREALQNLRLRPSAEFLEPVLRARASSPEEDSHLVYVARMTLRDQLRDSRILSQALARSWPDAEASLLADVLVGVDSEPAAEFLLARMRQAPQGEKREPRFVSHAARWLPAGRLPELIAMLRGQTGLPDQLAGLQALRSGLQARGTEWTLDSRRWAQSLLPRLLDSPEDRHRQAAFEIAGKLLMTSYTSRMSEALRNRENTVPVRVAAAEALMAVDPELHLSLLGDVARRRDEDSDIKMQMLRLLGEAKRGDVEEEIASALEAASPPLQNRIAPMLARRQGGPELLLNLVDKGTVRPHVLLRSGVSMAFSEAEPGLRERYAELTKNLEPEKDDLEMMRKFRRAVRSSDGDAVQGRAVYEKHCLRCHQINGEGKVIGPQLDGAQARGVDRLIEDILNPSLNVDASFRTRILSLRDGTQASGLVLREEGAALVLLEDSGEERTIQKDSITNTRESELSPMPADFADQISPEELNNLLAFLANGGRAAGGAGDSAGGAKR